MKTIFLFILVFSTSLASFSQLNIKYPLYKGNIDSVVDYNYDAGVRCTSGEKHEEMSGWVTVYEFDRNNQIVKQTNHFCDQIRAIYNFRRDTIGNKILLFEKDNTPGSKNSGYIETEVILDNAKRIIIQNHLFGDSTKNKLDLSSSYDSVRYNANGQVISYMYISKYRPDTTYRLFTQSYDSLSRLSQFESYDLYKSTILTEPKNGGSKFVDEIITEPRITDRTTFIYDEKGNIVCRELKNFRYGYIDEANSMDYADKVSYFEYDKKGNWIKHLDEKKHIISTRKIYYRKRFKIF